MKRKTCSKCKEEKPVGDYPLEKRHTDGRASECKACKKQREALARERISEQQRQWEQQNPEKQKARRGRYVRRHAAKVKARSDLNHAVERGDVIRPDACEVCGDPADTEAHHRDYNKPLEVEWLCRDCHDGRHNED